MDAIRAPLELRQAASGPGRIVRTLIQRVGSPTTAGRSSRRRTCANRATGLWLLAEHRGRQVMRFEPVVDGTEIRIDAELPDTPIDDRVRGRGRDPGRPEAGLSIEFVATDEARVQGMRQVRGALLDAVALVGEPAYQQAGLEVPRAGAGAALVAAVDAARVLVELACPDAAFAHQGRVYRSRLIGPLRLGLHCACDSRLQLAGNLGAGGSITLPC